MAGRARSAFWRDVACKAALFALAACTPTSKPSSDVAPHPDARTSAIPAASVIDASPRHRISRQVDAVVELGVLVDKSAKVFTVDDARALIVAKYCGDAATCDAVRAFLAEPTRVEISTVNVADWGLPPRSTLDTLAPGLSPRQRDDVYKRPTIIVVTTRGPAGKMCLPARAGFALTAAIAEKTRGLVYDDVVHRIETAEAFAGHAITSKLGEPVLRQEHFRIQAYQQDDGTARLLTLGLRRFGAPDLDVTGASITATKAFGILLNAVAARVVEGAEEVPLTIVLGSGKSATIDLQKPAPREGDPNNVLLQIVPAGGASTKGYDDLMAMLFASGDAGAPPLTVEHANDPRLALASERAARSFPAALTKWRKNAGSGAKLLVRLPFAIPGTDGGTEWMWVDVKSAEDTTIHGVLSNSPVYVHALSDGSTVSGKRSDIADWLMQSADGGTEGGETIKLLEGQK